MGSMAKKPLPRICTSDILHLFLGWWLCHHRHFFAKSAMSVLIIWSLVTPYTRVFLILLFSWAQCSHPIYWMLRDTIWSRCHIPFVGTPPALWQRCGWGLLSHNSIRNMLKDCVLVMFILMVIPALRARICELVLTLPRVYSFSEIIQITQQVDPLSWRLYTEMVSPIYFLFSLSF